MRIAKNLSTNGAAGVLKEYGYHAPRVTLILQSAKLDGDCVTNDHYVAWEHALGYTIVLRPKTHPTLPPTTV
jgi:hypothetical protein